MARGSPGFMTRRALQIFPKGRRKIIVCFAFAHKPGQIMWSWVLLLVAFQCVVAFHKTNNLISKPRAWRSCCKPKIVPLGGVAKDHIDFGDKVLVSVKLPTPNRNIVETFIRNSDFLVENVWDKLKTKKTSDGTYVLGLSSIPVPGFSIINPEVNVRFTHIKGNSYIHFGKWHFKDGCGNMLKDESFVDNVQVQFNGKMRISHKNGPQQSEGFTRNTKLKRPVGGGPLYLECSVDYNVTANKPATLLDSAVVEKTIALLQSRVHDFMHVRLPLKLVKAFKTYGSKLQQSTEYWL